MKKITLLFLLIASIACGASDIGSSQNEPPNLVLQEPNNPEAAPVPPAVRRMESLGYSFKYNSDPDGYWETQHVRRGLVNPHLREWRLQHEWAK